MSQQVSVTSATPSLALAPDDDALARLAVEDAGERARANGARTAGHVLLIDDEENLVRVARRLLVQIGYEVSDFCRPSDALDAFARDPNRYDVLCTDLNMPGMSGVDLCRAVRQRRPGLPVVIVSGEGLEPFDETGEGPQAFLEKPYNRRTISAALAAVLKPR